MAEEKPFNPTMLMHSEYQAPSGFQAFPTAIHHASTVLFKDVASMRARHWQDKTGYTYGLHGTPTTFTLEARLAEIEGGQHCLLAPSGLAAIMMVNFALLKQGDHLLVPTNVYGPGRDLANWMARDFGVSVDHYDPMQPEQLAHKIRRDTRLVWTEAPGSISMEVPDIARLAAIAKSHGAWVAMDNTWSAGIAFRPFEHGVDISIQALTKFQSGGADLLMGAVIARDQTLSHCLQISHMRLGQGVSGDDAYRVLRSLPTLALRYEAHDRTGRSLAAWLAKRHEIARVLHPAFPSCPGHENWARDFKGAAGLFSVIFDERYAEAQVDHFVESLKLFKIGYSWGGANSLCIPYRMREVRSDWRHSGSLVRFYVGLERVEDLIADVEQAFESLRLGAAEST